MIIAGGGLSGLTLAYFLSKKGISAQVLEASPRLGGRIQTVEGTRGTPLELGATWFSDAHDNLLNLIDELSLTKFPQFSGGVSLFQTKSFEPPQQFFVPASESPSYRLAGGTQKLIDTLAARLPTGAIHLNKQVSAIRQLGSLLTVETADGTSFEARQVIVCIPPQLAATSIQFWPELPESVNAILPTVQTWMAGAVKFTLEYDEPFWRKDGYSGMLYSHAGIVTEMYDHTNFEEDKFAFTGFLNAGAASYEKEVRKELVLRQLFGLLGPKAMQPTAYFDKVWNDAYLVDGNPAFRRPHENNGHLVLHASYMDGKLHFCGTETAATFAGYMEGAVAAAASVCRKL